MEITATKKTTKLHPIWRIGVLKTGLLNQRLPLQNPNGEEKTPLPVQNQNPLQQDGTKDKKVCQVHRTDLPAATPQGQVLWPVRVHKRDLL